MPAQGCRGRSAPVAEHSGAAAPAPGLSARRLAASPGPQRLLEFVKLSQNGYANTFLRGCGEVECLPPGNFSSSPRTPKASSRSTAATRLWLQALSARVFGFAPLSLLIPEGICAVAAVALLYRIMAPRFGALAALAGAFALAVFPSFVAVSRDNAVDPLLILLMLASCAAALAAIDSGRLRTLAWCGVLAGLAFTPNRSPPCCAFRASAWGTFSARRDRGGPDRRAGGGGGRVRRRLRVLVAGRRSELPLHNALRWPAV